MIPNQRELFDLPHEVAYFNCASLAPLMRSAREAGVQGLTQRGQPWQILSGDWFTGAEQRRALFARLIGADAEGIALIPATSYGLAVAARNLRAGPAQSVIVIAEDYPSNVYTWRDFSRRTGCRLVTAQRSPGRSWTDAVLEEISHSTAIVAVPNVHWTDGALLDVRAIGRAARAVGARLVIDASQSLGAMSFDLAEVQPDFLVSVGYKWLLGPFGLGYLYVAPEHRNGEPLEQNWILREGARDFARLVDYTDRYQSGARRFDVGERTAFELTPAAVVCLEQILTWGVDNIAASLKRITDRIEREAAELGMLESNAAARGPHMTGLKISQATRTAAMLRESGVYVGVRGDSVRVSPHLYTSDEDIERLISALRKARSA